MCFVMATDRDEASHKFRQALRTACPEIDRLYIRFIGISDVLTFLKYSATCTDSYIDEKGQTEYFFVTQRFLA
jgi:hypothetical protein